MATKQDLFKAVKQLNDKHCKNTRNQLRVSQAYGGYEVQLTGKRDKRCKGKPKYLKGSLESGAVQITYGHLSATKTLETLQSFEFRGRVKETIKDYEKRRQHAVPRIRK